MQEIVKGNFRVQSGEGSFSYVIGFEDDGRVSLGLPSVAMSKERMVELLRHIGEEVEKYERHNLEPGDKVNYEGRENGVVKKLGSNKVFVVFNCGGDWENFEKYTAAMCKPRQLKRGWI